MIDLPTALICLAALLAAAAAVWVVSVIKRDVSIVDVLWGLLILLSAAVYAALFDTGPRAALVLTLVALWALRLSAYIGWRNHGQPEDRRYQAIRQRNEPHFAIKSVYLVFGLQGVLAWVVSLTLLASIGIQRPLGLLGWAGVALWIGGFIFEAVADWQLARFKADARNRGHVMDRGLWRYSRHPNYFGEFLIWWGAWLIALSAGAWWTIISPLLMSMLLLRVSGVALLEKDIGKRRPHYAQYRARTNAFFPGRPRQMQG